MTRIRRRAGRVCFRAGRTPRVPKKRRQRPLREVTVDVEQIVADMRAAASQPPPSPSPLGADRLPATGSCHTCGAEVSGERRYCGLCLANRTGEG